MEDNLPQFLQNLPDHLFGLSLLLCRVSMAVMLVPGFGDTDAPKMVRAGTAIALTLLLYPPLAAQMPAQSGTFQNIAMMASELAAGGLLGWLARLVALALPLGGQLISIQMGVSSVLQPDPELGAQTAVLGQMFSRALPVLILGTGLYRLPLEALAGSYSALPAGSFFAAGDAAQLVVRALSDFWALGVRLAAPFIFAGILWHCSLALIGRLVPRVQTYIVAAPGQIFGGLMLLALLIATMLRTWAAVTNTAWSALPGL